MKKVIDYFLSQMGFVLIRKRSLLQPEKLKTLNSYDLANARGKVGGGLEEELRMNNRLKWLEVGTGQNDSDGFDKIDIIDFPIGAAPSNYRKLDIVNCTDEELETLGQYDLVRMQHVFEHFTPEDGLRVLTNCSKLLKKGGYILISCPDIDIVIDYYLKGNIRKLNGNWGLDRIGENAPDSFYFSIFTHSVQHESHLWCYNSEGLVHQLEKSGKFCNIEVLGLGHSKASIPFTHNRPEQDVVVLGIKK